MTTADIVPACIADATWTLREFRSAARAAAGLAHRDNPPVVVVPGAAAPLEVGDAWHYTTPGGTLVRYPNAYRRYGRLVYHRSTRRVEVGADWRPAGAL